MIIVVVDLRLAKQHAQLSITTLSAPLQLALTVFVRKSAAGVIHATVY